MQVTSHPLTSRSSSSSQPSTPAGTSTDSGATLSTVATAASSPRSLPRTHSSATSVDALRGSSVSTAAGSVELAERGVQAGLADALPEIEIDHAAIARGKAAVRTAPGASHEAQVVANTMNKWLKRRPEVTSSMPLPYGDMALGFKSERAGIRGEAYILSQPGVKLAALALHPASPHQQALDDPDAHQGVRLPAAPLGLVSGTWSSQQGQTFRLHNGRLHRWQAAPGGAGQWQPDAQLARRQPPPQRLQMLGQQADGRVYLQSDTHLLCAGTDDAVPLNTASRPKVSVDRQGTAHLLDGDQWRQLQPGSAGPQPSRTLRLQRPDEDARGQFRAAQARPVDMALLDTAAGTTAVIVDDKGRLYEATPAGTGDMVARPAQLPHALGAADQWVVRSLGHGEDGHLHACLEDRDGRSMTIQRGPEGGWEPGFVLTQPLVLQVQTGLESPTDREIGHRITPLDGHAELGVHAGTAYYRPDPDAAWTRLEGPDGQALEGVQAIKAAPFGFVDRRPAYALVAGPGGAPAQITRLDMEGRTTTLPSGGPLADQLGGPLSVVPTKVRVSTGAPVAVLPPGLDAVDFVVTRDQSTAAVLASDGALYIGGNGGLQRRADTPAGTVGLTIGVDDRIVLLAGPVQDRQLYTLDPSAGAAPVPLALTNGDQEAGLVRVDLRASRAGTPEVALRSADGQDDITWHAVLPGLTDDQGQRGPGRIDPRPVDEPIRDGLYAGTASALMREQWTRVQSDRVDVRVAATLAGVSAGDATALGGPARATARGLRDHLRQMGQAAAQAGDFVLRAGLQMAGRPGIPAEQAVRLREVYDLAAVYTANLAAQLAGEQPLAPVPQATASAPVRAALAPLREAQLERALTDLQKIGIKLGAIDPTLEFQRRPDAGLTWSERLSALPAQAAAGIRRALVPSPDVETGLLPALRNHIVQLQTERDVPRSEREIELMGRLSSLCSQLKYAGVHLSLDNRITPRDPADPVALRRASLAQALDTFERLETAPSPEDARAIAAGLDEDPLKQVTDAGFVNWSAFEAYDDIVSTFRASMGQDDSVRRQQLLRALGLPADSAPDQVARQLTELALDLGNRSTFFSVASDALSVSLNIGRPGSFGAATGITASLGGEAIHAMGFERIGDSLEGDAGLVVFFVRHQKGQGSLSPGINGDLKAGTGKANVPYTDAGSDVTAQLSGGLSGGFRAAMSGQLGRGAAVIIPAGKVPDFMARLVDPGVSESWDLFQEGVGKKGIELNLVETNVSAEAGVNLSVTPLGVSGPLAQTEVSAPAGAESAGPSSGSGSPALPGGYGGLRPSDLPRPGRRAAAGGYGLPDTPGGYGNLPPPAARPAAPSSARTAMASASGQALVAVRGGGSVQAHEMALVLNHLWTPGMGVERQGSVQVKLSASAALRVGAGFSVPEGLGTGPSDPVVVGGGLGGLQLAGLNLSNADMVGMQSLVNGTYKRTLDAQTPLPMSPGDWTQTLDGLAKLLPAHANELRALPFGAQPRDRVATLQGLRARLETGAAANGAQPLSVRDGVTRARAQGAVETALQREQAAMTGRGVIIPGARIELNLMGRQALKRVPDYVMAHVGLSSLVGGLAEAQAQIPGLADAMSRLKTLRAVNQVRLVFEMTPAHLDQINSALVNNHVDGDWPVLMENTMRDPQLYRLAVVAVHNTDDNMSSAAVNVLPFASSRAAGTSKQQFMAEIQFQYDDAGQLSRALILEGAVRAMNLHSEQRLPGSVQPAAVPAPTRDPRHFGPASPR